jgi:hypothetical protein
MAKSAGEQVADTHRPNARAVHKSVAELKAEIDETRRRIATAIDLTTERVPTLFGGDSVPGDSERARRSIVARAGRALDLLRLARNALASIKSNPVTASTAVVGAVVGLTLVSSVRRRLHRENLTLASRDHST